MSEPRSVVIVGAAMAGARAAEELRVQGFSGRVVLLGEEDHPPYDRVPLSKHFLRSEPGFHRLFIHEEGYYDAHDIELRLGARAVAIDVADRQLELESGERMGYDRLLLATGSRASRLRVPGADLEGVHHLRGLADAERLRSALEGAGRVVVIGAGFLGSEVAATARQLGVAVALVGRGLPMERALGTRVATFYRDVHLAHGVELHLGSAVQALRGGRRVEEVVLTDGTTLEADVVVAGIGAKPRVELAEASGIAVHGGIVADEHLATSAPGVHAAGDVAAAWHPVLGGPLRLEHWSAARNQGPTAARNMLGAAEAYDRVPFFFTDQYDVWMEYTGYSCDGADLVLRGDPSTGETAQFVAFWLRGGRLVAGMNVNLKGLPDVIAGLVASGRSLDPDALADPDVDLTTL